MEELRKFDLQIGNSFDMLKPDLIPKYKALGKVTSNISSQFIPMIVRIGKL